MPSAFSGSKGSNARTSAQKPDCRTTACSGWRFAPPLTQGVRNLAGPEGVGFLLPRVDENDAGLGRNSRYVKFYRRVFRKDNDALAQPANLDVVFVVRENSRQGSKWKYR
jgi:hypothetical protein